MCTSFGHSCLGAHGKRSSDHDVIVTELKALGFDPRLVSVEGFSRPIQLMVIALSGNRKDAASQQRHLFHQVQF